MFRSAAVGLEGLLELGPTGNTVVVDVLRFTSCVSVACGRGAAVLPYDWNDASVEQCADEHDAEAADQRDDPVCT